MGVAVACALTSVIVAAPVAATQEQPTPRPLEDAPRLVVDTEDGAPTTVEREAARATFDRAMALDRADLLPGRVAASTGRDVFASYAPEATPPADVRSAIDRAIATVNATLVTDVALDVRFYWEPQNNNRLWGFAGPVSAAANHSSDPTVQTLRSVGLPEVLPTSSVYPIGLINQYLGADANGDGPEIFVTLNSDLYGWRWHTDPTAPPSDRVDIETVVLHELLHGLGFYGGADNATYAADGFWVYDEHVHHDQTPLAQLVDPSRYLTGGSLFFQLRGGERFEMFAPPLWQQGSSYSHLDQDSFPFGTEGSLMTPAGDAGQMNRAIDGPLRSILADMGWRLESSTLAGSVASSQTLAQILGAWDYSPVDADTLRLYQAFLDRDPDAPGAVYWISQTRSGASLDDLAYGFAQSTEFIARYGTLTNSDFLTLLYFNMLDRVPDQEGFDYWLGEMDRGLSQDGVVRWIVANAEFKLRYPWSPTAAVIAPGDAVNCVDFGSAAEAQRWFDHFDDDGDVAGLDPDGDGIACEIPYP